MEILHTKSQKVVAVDGREFTIEGTLTDNPTDYKTIITIKDDNGLELDRLAYNASTEKSMEECVSGVSDLVNEILGL